MLKKLKVTNCKDHCGSSDQYLKIGAHDNSIYSVSVNIWNNISNKMFTNTTFQVNYLG